jgi:CDGSH-type Zn-finger protein/truncated hemoglobin YjbI
VTNARLLLDWLGQSLPVRPQLALCRCGASDIKPLCDGSHAGIGFTGGKDPQRVPDRRDTYAGQQVTVYDNRGLCQHSGYCTGRLATVFRQGEEPFVTPSGGRMDEIIRAVRDCPSGALSYGIDEAEAREQADWGNTRDPVIEITRDGPYRVTGGIPLTDGQGQDEPRNAGGSREHYALCRCGHSQNKPFCSGMHWYVGFRDPVADPEREPTLFEWAGGRPALTRMTRLFCEKYLPGDPVLAPLFANLPPGLPQRMAARLGGAFGGPPSEGSGPSGSGVAPGGTARGDQQGGYPDLTQGLDEEQRDRWVALLGLAAREAGLPADPEFRAAFTSYIEWDSRVSPPQMPAPRWDWGPAGPPSAAVPQPQDDTEQPVTLPGPGQPVSFAAHIKPLFRQRDRDSMSFALDLWSYEDVKAHAADILKRLGEGSMPCDGAWPKDRVDVFARWTSTQMPA